MVYAQQDSSCHDYPAKGMQSGTKLKGVWGSCSPNLENLPHRMAKTVVQCTSAGQLTGPRTIGELLLP